MDGPRGPKPRRTFSRRNVFIYGTLTLVALYYMLPLYVMVVTSLKGMPEIRLGNIFAPPVEITFEPWVKTWAEACTGLNCDGLSRGFWNSVQITVPSVIVSILIFGAFIPYQVMLYPVVIMLREIGLYGSLSGLVIVHTIFGMPILTLLFRNYFVSLPEVLFKAARVDGARFRGHLPADHAADVASHLRCRDHSSGHGNLERFSLRCGLYQAGDISDDGAAQQYRQLGAGVKEYNVSMAATLLTGLVPLCIYFVSGKLFVRGIAAGAVKG